MIKNCVRRSVLSESVPSVIPPGRSRSEIVEAPVMLPSVVPPTLNVTVSQLEGQRYVNPPVLLVVPDAEAVE